MSGLLSRVQEFLGGFLDRLGQQTDKRYVYSFFDLFVAILSFRDRINGLVLSELGGYVNGAKKAPAGTKRISNLLRKANWKSSEIAEEFLNQSEEKLKDPAEQGKWWLMLWDDSVLEKPESWCDQRYTQSQQAAPVR